MKLTEIQDLIKFVARSGVTEVEIEQANFKITIKSDSEKKKSKGSQPQPEAYLQQPMHMMPQQMMPQQMQQPQQMQAPPQSAPAEPKKETSTEDNSKYITVKSPMIGTFYRSPGPDKDPFLSVGDDIKPGKVISIIEAMKL